MPDRRFRNMDTRDATENWSRTSHATDLVNRDLVRVWLWIVAAALLTWEFYYLVAYRSARHSGLSDSQFTNQP